MEKHQELLLKACLFLFFFYALMSFIVPPVLRIIKARKKKKRLKEIVSGAKTLTPRQFFALRQTYYGRMTDLEFEGVYIIYNINKKMFYVGQSVHVPSRVNAHFTGKGNGDVYADYKYGNRFEIRMVKLRGSGYNRLDDLERELIDMYRCCEKGYNRKKGNR